MMRLSDYTSEQLAAIAAQYREHAVTTSDQGVRSAMESKAAVYEELVDRRADSADITHRVQSMIDKLDGAPEKLERILA